ncbi:hypothetical protein CERZMDRAFT_99741 [Cercospora zeae-maydis SCOH1-5]|uniref:CR-type domain-containing protein n=1 Tax=Cercospora zeae-maydis SCOH1-5 TaxID=717836 RepID=A0A6A6F9H1_9PEZI|nr:hypothetical protein CERZMDRAFT_99741 [Cercospora zeae-maydis SCOH1-5]
MAIQHIPLTSPNTRNDKTFEEVFEASRPYGLDRSDSFQTKENTRRNSQHGSPLPPSHVFSPLLLAGVTPEPCQRCSGEGDVDKPCRFCKATGKTSEAVYCVDCDAEKNGCGNMNCDTCLGVGRLLRERRCMSCEGTGSGLKLTCGDCGGSGNSSPTSSRSGSEVSCHVIPE